MRVSKVLTDYSKLADADLIILAQGIVLSMTGNANFTTPDPALTTVNTAVSNYNDALSNAENGGELETALKVQAREDLEDVLADLALYVEKKSDEDEAKMLSSGFKISKQPEPVGPLPKPVNFNVTSEGKGEMKLRIKSVTGARSYQWEYRQVGAASWTTKINTKSTIMLTGLESGKEYEFRVVPVGTSEIREYSDVISSFVL